MGTSALCPLLVVLALCCKALASPCDQDLQWEAAPALQDGDVVYACAGSDLALNWTLTQATNVSDIDFIYNSSGSGGVPSVIASVSWLARGGGTFLPYKTYLKRLTMQGNAGLVLTKVTSEDSGTYQVKVTCTQGKHLRGNFTRFSSSVTVIVSDGLQTEDGELHVRQSDHIVTDAGTGEAHVELTCGKFNYKTRPPFRVLWKAPGGNLTESYKYSDGFFRLALANPIQSGEYECSLPPAARAAACLHDDGNHTASVTLDHTKAQLGLLAAANARLAAKMAAQSKAQADLIAAVASLSVRVDALGGHVSTVQARVNATEAAHAATRGDVDSVKDTTTKLKVDIDVSKVTQTALLTSLAEGSAVKSALWAAVQSQGAFLSIDADSGGVVRFSEVHLDRNNDYDRFKGLFTAPRNATYVIIIQLHGFSGSKVSPSLDNVHGFRGALLADGKEVASGTGGKGVALVIHAGLFLQKGARVWVTVLPLAQHKHLDLSAVLAHGGNGGHVDLYGAASSILAFQV